MEGAEDGARAEAQGGPKVTCRDIDGFIILHVSGAAIPPEVAAHIAGCERCRQLADAIGETQRTAPPSPESLTRIENRILADLKPVKPLAPTSVLFFALMFFLVVVAAIGSAALGTSGWRVLSALQRIAVFTALAATAGLLAFSAVRQIVPGSRLLLSPYWPEIAVLGVMTGILAALFHPREESAFVSRGLKCLGIGLEYAIPTALLAWLLLRRGAVLNPVLTGATAGILAGLSGLTVLEIHCPNLNAYHILAWHIGSVLASVLGGVAIGLMVAYSGGRRTRRIP